MTTPKNQLRVTSALSMIVVGILLMVMIYSGERDVGSWLTLVVVVVFFQFFKFKDKLEDSGFKPRKIFHKKFLLHLIVALVVFSTLGISFGLYLGESVQKFKISFDFWELIFYFAVVILQQYLLSCFYINRLEVVWGNGGKWNVILATGFIFAFFHNPNWFLMVVTFVGGIACAWHFLKYRNIYFLIVSHLIIGIFLNYFTPDVITHGMRVGPAYFK
ncbi:MAG: hypothetical protein COV29_03145 [Candidatus Yanofskybacteria bacterium CG10_big_fil_rev_8_21_14_0_10_36_16]|uniref:CAAX prenyl protease 2/Lysostaphin resistance protein A-like domain-containing protein n=1 Tax=Candidatus Yanofskybacteria bacterium CG10_big_fil_rev_8_21_14_0_10_36_16 TaxID=1975096 RepID=A0A2J0Q9N9_9BACT|nr:MAG: hypothetical protein COV29_03145 [Candidatus Yanofskybacteria bacterium CG10_big_fil_rev_8_21_14_0_10_36_16]